MPIEPAATATNADQPLSKRDEIDVLIVEYNRLSAETMMYIEQYSPKFTVFGAFVLSAFAFAFQHAEYQVVYAVIPLFIFLIGYIQIAQVHIITAQGGRVRNIESRIKEINNGVSIMEWESKVAMKLIYPPFVNVQLKGPAKRRVRRPNPIFMSVVFVLIAMLPLLAYSTWKAYCFIPRGWNLAYVALIVVFFIGISVQAFSFFTFGRISDAIDYQA
jgi:hypothetical protein